MLMQTKYLRFIILITAPTLFSVQAQTLKKAPKQYSYTSYPRFNETERIKLHYADLRLGVRF
jgi:hypothetical protein